MGIGTIILLCVLAVLLILLFSPIQIWLGYEGGKPSCSVRYLFLKASFPGESFPGESFPGEKHPRPEGQPKKKQKEQKQAKWTVKEIASIVIHAAKSGGRLSRGLLRHVVCSRLLFQAAVVGDDAADTALSYGKWNAVVYPLYGTAAGYITVKRARIDIRPDFTGAETRILLDCRFRIAPAILIGVSISAFFYFITGYFRIMKSGGQSK